MDSLIYRFEPRIVAVDLAVIRIWGVMVGRLEVKGAFFA